MDLSIIIPARNEIFLRRTIEDILEHKRGNTNIIAILDGYWPEPQIVDHKDVILVHHSESIGQRAAINEGVRLTTSKYVMKCDAHCSFAEGFDTVLLNDIEDNTTIVPTMRNLHAFDWVCEEGHRRYQGPSGVCTECGKPTKMDIVWIAKPSPQSNSYCFDTEPHFQYFGEYNKRPEGKGKITETMSLQGSCFMTSRYMFRKLNLCDEQFGSWGSQGIEVAVKTWLSGGRVLVDHNTYYAHMFRTQGGDFGFPYPLSGNQVTHAKKTARKQFFEGKLKHQVRPLSWLVEKFWPVPGWTEEDLKALKENDYE